VNSFSSNPRKKSTPYSREWRASLPNGPLYGRITLKDNKSNWGSCSAKGNINLNIRLHLLPEHLRDYVILH
jgi:predicted metal-dependent hydrolase